MTFSPNAKSALKLYRTENVGPVAYRHLIDRFGTAQAACDAIPQLAERGGRKKPLKVPSDRQIEKEISDGQALGAQLLCHLDSAFSKALWTCEDAPPILWCLGHPQMLSRPSVAIVGARNASANGLRLATTLAQDLSDQGLVVVSGLARGLDGAAHSGAIRGAAGTIAVLAGGVDHIYPSEHDTLYRQIIEQGLIVSEMPPGTRAQARHFPRRNRIISGLSLGTVVVEAARRSGSLITARTASEQGRIVFAVPGHPMDQRAHGPNDLIRDGATLIQSADDILEDIKPLLQNHMYEPGITAPKPPPPSLTEADLSPAREKIYDLLGTAPTLIDELVRQSGSAPSVVHTVLLELELAGRLTRYAGQKVSLVTMDGEANNDETHQGSLFRSL